MRTASLALPLARIASMVQRLALLDQLAAVFGHDDRLMPHRPQDAAIKIAHIAFVVGDGNA